MKTYIFGNMQRFDMRLKEITCLIKWWKIITKLENA